MAYFQYDRDTISKEQLDSMLAFVIGSIESNPIASDLWNTLSGGALNTSYVAYVNEMLQSR
jgi:hypothetical protein